MEILGCGRRVARRGLAGLFAAGALTALSACGGGGESSTLKVTETQRGANQYAFTGVDPVKGGTVKITLTNKGKANHEIQLVRVDGKHAQAQVLADLQKVISGMNQPLPGYLHPTGGVADVKAGQTGTATVVLAPGSYVAVDTNSPGMQGSGPPYFTQGAAKALQVKGGKSSGSLPVARQTVAIRDVPGDKFDFVSPASIAAGKTTLELDNQSKKEFHQITLAPIAPGKTLADVKKALASNGPPTGPPPLNFDAGQGTSVIEHSSKLVTEVNLKPGTYAMLCSVQDRDGKGPPHFLKGLLKEVKVS